MKRVSCMAKQRWMWVDWLIFSLRCGWFGTGLIYFYEYSEKLGGLSYTVFAFSVTASFLFPLLFWRPNYHNPNYYAIAEIIVTGGFSIYSNNIVGVPLSTSIILMPILMIGYMATRKTALWTIPIFVILLPANRFFTLENSFEFYLQYIDVVLFFCIGIGFNLITKSQKRYKRLLNENLNQYELIQQQHEALKQYAVEVKEMALLEERNRMARDLHDSIGHYFTTVTVGLDAVTYMIKSDQNRAEDNIRRLADISRKGLTEIRNTIHQIAPSAEDFPLSVQLENLIKDFGIHTNTTVDYELTGEEKDLALSIKRTIYRCLQEGLTNGKRHGNASYFRVTLAFREHEINLVVFNNGSKIKNNGYGFGLNAMKQRVEQFNGTICLENQDDGVLLTCSIPNGGSL